MLIVMCGDTHGNIFAMDLAFTLADEIEAAGIIHLGDYGFWPNDQHFAARTRKWVKRTGKFVAIVTGNHDAPGAGNKGDGGYLAWLANDVQPGTFGALERGAKFELDGVTFGALGGAISVDRARRSLGYSYWLEEAVTDEDVAKAVSNGPVDVWLTHDTVQAPPGVTPYPQWIRNDQSLYVDLLAQRERMQTVFDAVQPKLHVHGHWHMRYTSESHGCRTVGLDADGCNGMLAVLDTETLTLR
jgi:predicted phosphodiesterase